MVMAQQKFSNIIEDNGDLFLQSDLNIIYMTILQNKDLLK